MEYCRICGEPGCKKHAFFLGKTSGVMEFSGSSPPEIFIGRHGYPNINIGILSPQEHGDTSLLSSPEEWHKHQLSIAEIVGLRSRLIYGRTQAHIKSLRQSQHRRFLSTMQEVAMTCKSVGAEFRLKKPVSANREIDIRTPLIANAAPVEHVWLQENPKIEPKVERVVEDTDLKLADAVNELYRHDASVSSIIKILSAGLLGLKKNRKLVPTRWAITAVDDTLSKARLEKIRHYPEIPEIQVFSSEYLGNRYEFLLLPDKWSLEVIEISLGHGGAWQDYEGFFPRKKYAGSVTGAYYANRLAVCEYLGKIQRQASVLVMREILPEYNVPLGVGILREASRAAFQKPAQKHSTIQEALAGIQTRLKQPVTNYTNRSKLLAEFGKQARLSRFF